MLTVPVDNVPVVKEGNKTDSYLEYFLDTEIELLILKIPLSIVKSQVLNKVLLLCEECIDQKKDFNHFKRLLSNDPEINELLTSDALDKLEDLFMKISALESKNWDKIWCRILKNNFVSKSFKKFDFIIGNPPWVRWSRLPETYRNRVKGFCKHYGLVSGRGYSGGIESDISTVIVYSSVDDRLFNYMDSF